MGTVTIQDDDSTRRYELRRLDGDHSVEVAWPSGATATPVRAVPDGGRTTAATEVGRTDREYGRDPGASSDTLDEFAWLAFAPFALTLVGLAAGLLFGFELFDTGTAGAPTLLPYVVLVPYFLVGLAGTLWLFRDARRLAATGADWQPNSWLYVLGGACVLELYYLVPVIRGEVEPPVVPYLAGGFVLAVLLSAVVAGPVYLLVRRRALD
ncbi:hypothetical protein [Halobacterium wangiae]|uniref:hypothetical protein n=1 Tax=Halobacterium wangiae TaxID=2902623 RepID=UPI001E283EE4|nr:hypothetical protein [Halobacterium wangiae]